MPIRLYLRGWLTLNYPVFVYYSLSFSIIIMYCWKWSPEITFILIFLGEYQKNET